MTLNAWRKMALIVRAEQVGDEQAIYDLTVEAFEPMSYSDGSEAIIINDLRKNGDLTVSLVAINNAEIAAHIAFSPVAISGKSNGWYGLGPVSVRPDVQRNGIGSRIINEGLSMLKSKGAAGCTLIGDPDYYVRFGFKSDGRLHYEDLSDNLVQWLSFGEEIAEGNLEFCAAFRR